MSPTLPPTTPEPSPPEPRHSATDTNDGPARLDDFPDTFNPLRAETPEGVDSVPPLRPTADLNSDAAAQIPMLTEVVPVQQYDKARLPVEWTEGDWERLADRVRDTLLERLLRNSDSMLQARFDETMRPALDRLADMLRDEMRVQVQAMVRDVVARGITDELGRVHAEIARRQRSRVGRG